MARGDAFHSINAGLIENAVLDSRCNRPILRQPDLRPGNTAISLSGQRQLG